MGEAILWLATQIGLGFWNLFQAASNPALWLDWSDPESLLRFIYHGSSKEFFFVVFDMFLVVTIAGLIWRRFLWSVVVTFESISNTVGRLAAWAGLLMVVQQIMVVFLQSVFRVSEITISPFGLGFTYQLGWFADGLKFENAIVVALCCGYTFAQGAHVRVDLIYAAVRHRTKKAIDMFGSLFFMAPMGFLIWFYAWPFLWRSLITPKVSASDQLDAMLRKAPVLRWNVETIGFSPNGFNAYFLFKVLMVALAAMILMQAVAFFYRSLLEFLEGDGSADKYLDRDRLDSGPRPHPSGEVL